MAASGGTAEIKLAKDNNGGLSQPRVSLAKVPRRDKLGNLAAVAGCGARREEEP
ncbi:MAG: hypothetical protein V7606_386 [Burkholderiales bacterium]